MKSENQQFISNCIIRTAPVEKLPSFPDHDFALFSVMDVPIDVSPELASDIEPYIMLSPVSLGVINDPGNAKTDVPPPKVDIPSTRCESRG
jgi:hypothetical protein